MAPHPTRARKRVLVYLDADLWSIAQSINRAADDRVCDTDGTPLLRAEEFRERYGVSASSLHRWHDRETRILDRPLSGLCPGNQALRGAELPSPHRNGHAKVWRWRLDDFDRIRRGKERKYPRVADKEVRTWLKQLLAPGPQRHDDVKRAAEDHDPKIPHMKLWKAKKALRVKSEEDPSSGVWYWRLDGRPALEKPPIPPRATPEEDQARDNKYPGHRRATQARGPQPDEARETVLKFCYDEYILKGRAQRDVLEDAQRFGSRYAPRTTEYVRVFARQWASRWEPTLPLDRPARSG